MVVAVAAGLPECIVLYSIHLPHSTHWQVPVALFLSMLPIGGQLGVLVRTITRKPGTQLLNYTCLTASLMRAYLRSSCCECTALSALKAKHLVVPKGMYSKHSALRERGDNEAAVGKRRVLHDRGPILSKLSKSARPPPLIRTPQKITCALHKDMQC